MVIIKGYKGCGNLLMFDPKSKEFPPKFEPVKIVHSFNFESNYNSIA